ncbi:DUF1499 domain-containing protein [Aliinostoc sp. HNIBRCY26]|uniref:DUF1499 domain-containing protein n=1 Tax=Aliinostoc sp. HNIBRCY26 TaxID=3418997 RepID=UPI003CFF2A28
MFRLLSTACTQRRLWNVACVIFFSVSSILLFPVATWANSSGLGVHLGHLSACPMTDNCVVSQDGDAKHAIDPIAYHVDRDTARKTLLKVLTVVPRTEILEDKENYIYAISKSRIFKFVDDVEFYFPPNESVIHMRSASRVGESDLGVNRRRLEQIRLALRDLNV